MNEFDKYYISPVYSSVYHRDEIDIKYKLVLNNGYEYYLSAPLMNAAMDSVASPDFLREMTKLKLLPVLHRNCTPEQQHRDFIESDLHGLDSPFVLSVGIHDYMDRIEQFFPNRDQLLASPMIISIDVGHGHSKAVKNAANYIDHKYPYSTVIAGSIVTKSAAQDYTQWGIDYARVGIGNGSACTTRDKTGIEVPQIPAIQAVSRRILTIADGGIEKPADVVKCLVAGADLVMVGKLFAGTEEAPGKFAVNLKGDTCRVHRGMASETVSQMMSDSSYVEGKEVLVPYTGKLEEVVLNITNGLRSAMSYLNAHTLYKITNGELIRHD